MWNGLRVADSPLKNTVTTNRYCGVEPIDPACRVCKNMISVPQSVVPNSRSGTSETETALDLLNTFAILLMSYQLATSLKRWSRVIEFKLGSATLQCVRTGSGGYHHTEVVPRLRL